MTIKYVYFFSGSMIESNALASKLSIHNIKFIIKDEQNSANLAGFGVPNYLFSHKVFVNKNDLEKAKLICR